MNGAIDSFSLDEMRATADRLFATPVDRRMGIPSADEIEAQMLNFTRVASLRNGAVGPNCQSVAMLAPDASWRDVALGKPFYFEWGTAADEDHSVRIRYFEGESGSGSSGYAPWIVGPNIIHPPAELLGNSLLVDWGGLRIVAISGPRVGTLGGQRHVPRRMS